MSCSGLDMRRTSNRKEGEMSIYSSLWKNINMF